MADDILSYLSRLRPSLRVALALSFGWLLLVAIFMLFAGGAAASILPVIMILLSIVGPIAIVASGALGVALMEQNAEIEDLRHELSHRERAQPPRGGAAPDAALKRVSQQLGEVTDRLAELETWLAQRAPAIERADEILNAPPAQAPMAEPAEDEGPGLDLDPHPGPADPPLSLDALTRALQFPADTEDGEGFDALRRALRDRRAAQIVIAAQDVLTLLSQDGLYMDDLKAEPAPMTLWRRFADGERGPEVAPLGGIRDEEALDRCRSRMRQDTIYRDAVHHFLRLFDHRLAEIAPQASDAELAAWVETRSARAFMLLGRASGIFS
ncbi:hypothetical protein [Palleronia sp. LCG004]|uniref:hypothetical protein n=1 Tax=Palleronia sp. LCG004 TaxID=3079304 RepID=UPI002941E3E4|nr:hypothetical protein [Palleronia sp. LCG004]WOI56378.1 hypothetical protein RVY76_00870 [Palleronia sp. LCG004]